MIIDEAIERNETIIKKGELGDVLTAYPALQLGIEALKGIKAVRQLHPELSPFPLLGETKD